MDFLGVVPKLQNAEHGGRDHMCFTADLFETRPSFGEMMAYRPMATSVEQLITKLMERKKCAFVYVGIFVDERGAVVLAKAKRGMQLDNARCGISTILAPLPAEQRLCVSRSLHAFDELDKVRLDAWKTVTSLRPQFSYAPKPERTEPCPTTLQGFIDSLSDSEDEDAVPMLSIRDGRLSLTDSQAQDTMHDTTPGEAELYRAAEALYRETWTTSAEHQAVVVMLSVGSPLEELSYIHCHREERRVALLCSRLPALPDLCETVAIAAQMAQEGSLPAPTGPRARKAEFLRRCEAALTKKNPLAERDVKKVPAQDQRKIALALGGSDTQCSRCSKPAVTSVEFSLAWLDGVQEVNPDTRLFCAACKPSHAAVCIRCGRHDTLVQEGARPPISLTQFLGAHIILGLRCTVCKALAVAPMTAGEKRKCDWAASEGVVKGRRV